MSENEGYFLFGCLIPLLIGALIGGKALATYWFLMIAIGLIGFIFICIWWAGKNKKAEPKKEEPPKQYAESETKSEEELKLEAMIREWNEEACPSIFEDEEDEDDLLPRL